MSRLGIYCYLLYSVFAAGLTLGSEAYGQRQPLLQETKWQARSRKGIGWLVSVSGLLPKQRLWLSTSLRMTKRLCLGRKCRCYCQGMSSRHDCHGAGGRISLR
jgi:hypothetical protein